MRRKLLKEKFGADWKAHDLSIERMRLHPVVMYKPNQIPEPKVRK